MPDLGTSPRRPWQPKRTTQGRRTHSNQKFYNSTAWRRARAAYIAQHPLCVHCKEEDRITAGDVVDHKTPINQGGDPFDHGNLQTLCHRHHNIKSGQEAHNNSPKGEGGDDL